MDASRLVTRDGLSADLRALGLAPGDTVMMHESVRAIGWVVGGPDVVLDAVLDVLGEAGTLMKLVGVEDATYELASWPEEAQRVYLEACPAFDPARTRAYRPWGILTEYLRTRAGAVRSAHPEASFAAVGPRAAWLVDPHPLDDGYGPGGPLARLVEARGRVLLLGAPHDSVTLLHHAEYLAELPHKRRVRYRAPILQHGTRTWAEIEELDSGDGIVAWPGGDYFGGIVDAYLADGRARRGTVGHAASCLLDAADLCAFGRAWMERELLPYACAT